MKKHHIEFPILTKLLLLLIFIGVVSVKIFPENSNNKVLSSKKSLNVDEAKQGDNKDLTLEHIIIKVLKKNMDLSVFKWDIRSKDGDIIQSALLPNPEIEFEIENFAGTGETRFFRHFETALTVGQKILLGGKRRKRIKTAELDRKISIREYNRKLSELLSEIRKRFITTLLIQKKLVLREEMVGLSRKFIKRISVRVKAGRTSPAELSRARVSLMRNQLALKRLQMEMFSAKQQLATLWGATEADFNLVNGHANITSFFTKLQSFKNRLPENPLLKSIASEIDFRRSVLNLEQANKIPDATISGGLRRFNENGDVSLSMSLSIPIPLKRTNVGAIKSAGYLLKKTQSRYHAAEIKLKNEIIETYKMLKSTYNNASILNKKILPEAEKTLKTILNGYDQGKFGYLEVFDAYRTHLEVKEECFENGTKYMLLLIELERLTGKGLEKLKLNYIKKGEANEKK